MTFPWVALGAGVAVLTGAVLVSCRSAGSREANLQPLELDDVARGATSAVMEESARVVRDEGEWQALWSSHARLQLPPPPAPVVDFRDSMIVAVFAGQCPSAGYGVVIDEVASVRGRSEHDEVLVRATVTAPEEGAMAAQMVTSPFHFVRVPRSDGDLVMDWGR